MMQKEESMDDQARPDHDEEDAPGALFFVLLRHGIAEERTEGRNDEERSLTAKGSSRMKDIGRALQVIVPKAELIISSPLARCLQTSLWVAKGYGRKLKIESSDALKPMARTREFMTLIGQLSNRVVIFVGHEPNLTAVMKAITGSKIPNLELKKGGCYGISMDGASEGMLEWLLTPRVLRKLRK